MCKRMREDVRMYPTCAAFERECVSCHVSACAGVCLSHVGEYVGDCVRSRYSWRQSRPLPYDGTAH